MEAYEQMLFPSIDAENRAIRSFLRYYGGSVVCTVAGMKTNLTLSGFDKFWPQAMETITGHLTTADAQEWLRYLFNLENREWLIKTFGADKPTK